MKKALAIMLTIIIAASAFAMVLTAEAKPFMNWRINFDRGNSHKFATQQSFVRLDGPIQKWGNANVTGGLLAQSRTVIINETSTRQGSSARAIWTDNASRPISYYRAKENFTYAFYSANLVNANISSVGIDGYSFFLNGTWNVNKVTTNMTIIVNDEGVVTSMHREQDLSLIASKAYGELMVSSTGNNFTLKIDEIDALNGQVHAQRITSKTFNPFIVGDNDGVSKLTKTDVSSVIKVYGSSPGWGNYDQRVDYDFNYKVDVCDLATATANFNI
jgi:hypothetical protein